MTNTAHSEAAFAAVLGAHQLHARISDNAVYCGNWRDHDAQSDRGLFHLLGTGACWVRSSVLDEPLHLSAGDLVMFPQGSEHFLSASQDMPRSSDTQFTTMLCGEFEFGSGRNNPICDALPSCFVVRESDSGSEFRRLAQLMSEEANRKSFASQIVLDKLADALFVMAVRYHVERAPEQRGLLAALADTRLARVLAAIHTEPGRDWTVASLAEIAHQSRSAFAQLFTEVLGIGPYEYLTEWRMTEALRMLADPRVSAAAVGEKLGYQTDSAFRRAFKRVHGFGPGVARRAQKAP